MKTITTNLQISQQLYWMFNSYYQVTELTEGAEAIHMEEVIAEKDDQKLTGKHLVAYLAIIKAMEDEPMEVWEQKIWREHLINDFKDNPLETVASMDDLFCDLLKHIIRMN